MRLHKAYDIVLTIVFVGIFGCLWLMGFVFGSVSPDYGYILVGLGIKSVVAGDNDDEDAYIGRL